MIRHSFGFGDDEIRFTGDTVRREACRRKLLSRNQYKENNQIQITLGEKERERTIIKKKGFELFDDP